MEDLNISGLILIDSFLLLLCSPGGIPARSEKGERLLLFIGIIDILQSYQLKKKLEHTFKSIIHDGVSEKENAASPSPSFPFDLKH